METRETTTKMLEAVPNLLYEQLEELKKKSETASNKEIILISKEICEMTQILTQFLNDIGIVNNIWQKSYDTAIKETKRTLIVASIALGVSVFTLIMNVLGII